MSLNPAPLAPAKPARGVSCLCGCVTRTRRYPTDMTDAQWAVLEPLLPTPACQRPTGGRPETHHGRAVLDAIFYLVDNGVKWRALPADFPPWRTVYGLFARWSDNLATIELTDRLRASLRVAPGRNPQPTAGCIDSQSVAESAEAVVPARTSGFDFYKGQRPQTPHQRRHPRPPTPRRGHRRQHPRPTRRQSPATRRRPPQHPPATSGPTRATTPTP